MGTFLGAVNIALGSLAAEQAALGVTSNNIANVNTPGYSRERAIFQETAPTFYGSQLVGQGVTLDHIQSLRDPVLQYRIADETQRQNGLNAYSRDRKSVV